MRLFITSTVLAAASLLACGTSAAAGAGGMHMGTRPATHATAATTRTAQSTLRGPSHTGQPNQTCGSATAPNTPGNAAAAPGSAFNPSGTAGSVYAGEQPQNSRNTASVSQYDVACFHQP
jgi:hypothetical protein